MQPDFDKAAALVRVDGDAMFLRELVGVFLDDAALRLSAIREAIARGDHTALTRAAHSLKGAAASIGAAAVSDAAQRLERLADERDLAQAGTAGVVLEAALEQLRPLLTEFIGGADSATAGFVPPSPAATRLNGQARVLVIDDDPTVRLATCQALLVAHFDVLTAATGDDGVRLAREARPDIILLDVVLPGESGLEVCQRIKGDPMLAEIPVLMASAQRTSSGNRANGLDAGADGYIVRPVENHELVAWVRALLRVKAAEAERGRLRTQLRQAQKLEAIGRLAGGVAHDFNNHLTVMKGYLQLVLRELAAADPCRADAERVDATIDKCARLVSQLLTFSRRAPLTTAALDLNELVGELMPMLSMLLGEQVRLRVRAAPALRCVQADRQQIEQVLMNLACNARDAMAATGDTLTVETANIEAHAFARHVVDGPVAAGSYVMLAVSDNGPGMPADVLERIFEPFFTTKEVGKGTGLGLAAVFGIMKQHRGYIACDSAPGCGTTFRLYLPSVQRSARAVSAPTAAVAPERRPAMGRPSILVVEDEDNLRALLVQTLEDVGYRVYAAANADEAQAVVARVGGTIDVLVTDVVMPGDSGPTLARHLAGSYSDLAVIFISGYMPDRLDLDAVPGARFLQKPFEVGDLVRTIDELLRRRGE